ncbi:MAG: DUF4136 domain-containing protein [Deltaproteobacteria bacterium]|nr:DUF4136 domain-containing protein [Deltaproteobacteria bacterium]MBW2724628.1 DUF4136 domain-containing protein [Deltaproteobacteria bacterium]
MRMAVLMAVVTLGCSSPGSIPVVQSEYWKDHDFGAFHRYALLASDASHSEQTQSVDTRAHDLIQEIIDERLSAKGFVRSEASEADLWVTYQFKISEKTKVERIDRVWVGSGDDADWEEVVPRLEFSSFDEGSIVIDFLKPGSDERVWRGVAKGRVSRDAKREQLDAIVNQSVRSILGEFPPKT